MKFIPRFRDFSMGRKRREGGVGGGPELLLLLCVLLRGANSYGEVGEYTCVYIYKYHAHHRSIDLYMYIIRQLNSYLSLSRRAHANHVYSWCGCITRRVGIPFDEVFFFRLNRYISTHVHAETLEKRRRALVGLKRSFNYFSLRWRRGISFSLFSFYIAHARVVYIYIQCVCVSGRFSQMGLLNYSTRIHAVSASFLINPVYRRDIVYIFPNLIPSEIT